MKSISIAPKVFLSILLTAFLLTGCQGKPVPADKKDYVGDWYSPEMTLLIMQDGGIDYKRISGSGGKTTINGPIKEYEGDNFVVGFLFLTTTFEVQKKPYKDGNDWKMVVDGVTLVRKNPGHG